ncbi:MAG: hypothetical protein WAL30_00735 [Candidatus Aquirickettsiella sp.]
MPGDYVAINSEALSDSLQESTHEFDSKRLSVNSLAPEAVRDPNGFLYTTPRPAYLNDPLAIDLISDNSEYSPESRSNSLILEDDPLNTFEIDNLLTLENLNPAFRIILKNEYEKVFRETLSTEGLAIASDILLSVEDLAAPGANLVQDTLEALLADPHKKNELKDAFSDLSPQEKIVSTKEALIKKLLEKIITDEQVVIRSAVATISRHYPFCNPILLAVVEQIQDNAKQLALHTNNIIQTIKATTNYNEIKKTLTSLLFPIALDTAANLFKSEDFDDLVNFQTMLREKIDNESDAIISFLSNVNKSKKTIISILNRIKNLPPPLHYLDELKKSLPFIHYIENLDITTPIQEIAEKTLLGACASYFLNTKTQQPIESKIKSDLTVKLAALDLNPEDSSQTIDKFVDTLTDKIFKIDNITNTVDLAKSQLSATQAYNLLHTTESLLIKSIQETIENFIKENFFYAVIPSILKKIDGGKKLTADEIAHIASIQYTDTTEEFYGVLLALGCHKTSIESYQRSYEEIKIANIRNKVRQYYSSEDFDLDELSTKEWLKKRFYIKTKQRLSLKLDKHEQAYIDNFFMDNQISLFPELDHYVISSLSEKDLTNERANRQTLKDQLIASSQTIYTKINHYWKIDYPELLVQPISSDNESQDSGVDSDEEDAQDEYCVGRYFCNTINNKLDVEHHLNAAQNETLSHIILSLNRTLLKPRKTNFFNKTDYRTPLISHIETVNLQTAIGNRLSKIQLNKFVEILLQDKNENKFLDRANFRSDYAQKIRILHGIVERINAFREVLTQQQWLLQSMLDLRQKQAPQQKSSSQPGESYLPLQCREISSSDECFQNSYKPSAIAQGGAFYKQNELDHQGTVRYEQNLGHEKKIWSITREKNTLKYRNEKSSRWSSATVTLDVARAQILDVMNRFTDPIVTLSINNCNKASERNYRLVIRAYNERNTGRQILCPQNKKINMRSAELNQELTKQQDLFKLQPKTTRTVVNKIQEITNNPISIRM